MMPRWTRIRGDDFTLTTSDKKTTSVESQWKAIVMRQSNTSTLAAAAAAASVEVEMEKWTDPDFPAELVSIVGPPKKTKKKEHTSAIKRCRCGYPVKAARVKKDTPNKGRSYVCCAARKCGFFEWNSPRTYSYYWRRFPNLLLVTDFGFNARDLRQGGVGDCWFLSALAVVAERHDLIAKLFLDTVVNQADCYGCRLFLDGRWTTTLVDGRLPCTGTPRRAQHALDTKLAFSRADNHQKWVCILEKAYAKAHGSYHAISGGHIVEALLDLTGAPTYSIDFSSANFDMSRLWRQLLHFRMCQYPMGCGTDPNPQLRQVGLCGSHAYSILDVRDIVDPSIEHGRVRLLRVRNPHGVGEWKGDWSDHSEKWNQLVRSHGTGSFERTRDDDGTFWIDLTHFVMAFSCVDVCFARRELDGYHARSFRNRFPAKKGAPMRTCESVYFVRTSGKVAAHTATGIESSAPTSFLHIMTLQPTKRGAWCREDRKKSYKPGDLGVLVLRVAVVLDKERKGAAKEEIRVLEATRLALYGAHRGSAHSSTPVLLRANETYLVVLLNLGGPPAAAETRVSQPFRVRMCSNDPFDVREVSNACRDRRLKRSILLGLHDALRLRNIRVRCEDPRYDLFKSMAQRMRSQILLRQRTAGGGEHVEVWAVTFGEGGGSDVVVIVGKHAGGDGEAGRRSVCVEIVAKVKVMTARSCESVSGDIVKPHADLTTMANEEEKARKAADTSNFRPRRARYFLAKWKVFRSVCEIPPGTVRVLTTLIAGGVQHSLGSLQARILRGDDACGSGEERFFEKKKKKIASLDAWLDTPAIVSGSKPATAATSLSSRTLLGVFDPIDRSTLLSTCSDLVVCSSTSREENANRSVGISSGADSPDSALRAAVAMSLEQERLDRALRESMRTSVKDEMNRRRTTDPSELQRAIDASLAFEHPEERALKRALRESKEAAQQADSTKKRFRFSPPSTVIENEVEKRKQTVVDLCSPSPRSSQEVVAVVDSDDQENTRTDAGATRNRPSRDELRRLRMRRFDRSN